MRFKLDEDKIRASFPKAKRAMVRERKDQGIDRRLSASNVGSADIMRGIAGCGRMRVASETKTTLMWHLTSRKEAWATTG